MTRETVYRTFAIAALTAAASVLPVASTDPLVEGWKPIPVIWEVAIKDAGFGLNSTIEKVEIEGAKQLYRVADGEKGQSFHICLDEKLALDTLKPLNLSKDDLFVCRDAALDDSAAANLALQCRLHTI